MTQDNDDDEMKFFDCLYDLPVCDVVYLGSLLGLNYADRFAKLDDDDDDGYSELRFALLNEITDKVFPPQIEIYFSEGE